MRCGSWLRHRPVGRPVEMELCLLTVGKPALGYARAGLEEYLGRMRGRMEWKVVKAGGREEEGRRLLEASRGFRRVVVDERGRELSSRGLADLWTKWEREAVGRAAFLIGGADGHGEEVRAAADFCWSLGAATLAHELAAVVVAEQLYRAHTLRSGHPYHRD